MAGKDSTHAAGPAPRKGAGGPKQASLARGAEAERHAADWLAAQGLTVIARNVRYRGGEIDLVCRDRDTLVFVEVRQRSSASFGGAAASITEAKRRRLVLAARIFLATHPQFAALPARFDCLLLGRLPDPAPQWLRDAFAAD
jgi:putative endonuclease